jgi:hypothetical protein
MQQRHEGIRRYLCNVPRPAVVAVALMLGLAPPAGAQSLGTPTPLDESQIVYFSHASRGWTSVPAVVVSGRSDDPRAPLVVEAVDFWNSQLAQIGSAFRIGPISYTSTTVADDFLQRRSQSALGAADAADVPDSFNTMPGDIVVALSDAEFVSFSSRMGGKVLLGIRNGRSVPLNLSNVAVNVITHEMGHAIGLGHNDDQTKLMCGRPALCRPFAFVSDQEHIFPITAVEAGFLLQLYPSNWVPGNG